MSVTCVAPPQLDDRELLAYLDSEANRQVAGHLEQCPFCRERAKRLARFQDRLTTQLYRSLCPAPTELGEYHLGILPYDQAAAVEQHLAECTHCSREHAQLKEYLAALAPDLGSSTLERIRVLVAKLIRAPGEARVPMAPALAPVHAGLRGKEEGPFLYQAGETQIAIEIQDSINRQDHRTLLGLITGIDAGGSKVYLWLTEELVGTVLVDEAGNFHFAGLAGGSYELILSSAELKLEVHIRELQI